MNPGALLLTLVLAQAPAEAPCDAACERTAAETLLRGKQLRPAIERLTAAVDAHPENVALPLLLARAYILDGNLFWAEKTLRAALDRISDDPELHHWLALVHLRQGDPELARGVLATASEAPATPDRTRHSLLSSYCAMLAGDVPAAREALASIRNDAAILGEDRAAWLTLERQLDPRYLDPFSGRIRLGAGQTSNALAGSPTDPGRPGSSSGIAEGQVRLRFAPALAPAIRPVVEFDGDGELLARDAYRELSTLELRGRAGVMLLRETVRVLAGYRAESLHLDQEPSRFADASRGELEIESARGWVLFGGAGHRTYRDERRTRDEWDAGGGGALRIGPLRLVVGATLRGASASSPAYDLRGATIAASAGIPAPGTLRARLSGSISRDEYPNSGGTEGRIVFGTDAVRRDMTGRLAVELWTRPSHGIRTGIAGELARRDSTADDRPGFDFDYTEARLVVHLRFDFAANRSVPRAAMPPGHIPLPWGLSGEGGTEAERVIELLRQDEELRRGSSCGL
jgi:tetratricopeptide (TPR) repeat protein